MPHQPRKRKKWPILTIGSVVVVAILVLLAMVFRFISGTSFFSSTIHIVSYVDNAAGLQAGAVVSLQGVRIGNVYDVRFPPSPPDPAKPVRIDMRVTTGQSQWLRLDSVVQVVTSGTMGNAAVEINGGTPDSPPAVNGSLLPSRAATPTTAVVISAHTLIGNTSLLMQQFSSMMGRLKTGTAGKLMSSNELERHLAAISRNTASLKTALRSGPGSVARLTSGHAIPNAFRRTRASVTSLHQKIASASGTLGRFQSQHDFSDELAQLRAGIRLTSQRIHNGNGAVGALLHSPPVRQNLAGVAQGFHQVAAAHGSLSQFASNPTLSRNTHQLGRQVHTLIQEMRSNPGKFFRMHLDLF